MRATKVFDDIKDAEHKRLQKEREDAQYDDYSRKVLEEYSAAGKDIKPLLLCIQK